VSSDARHWISMLWDTAGESKGRPHPSPLHAVEREQTERGRQQYPLGEQDTGDHKGPPNHASPPSPLRKGDFLLDSSGDRLLLYYISEYPDM